MGTLADLQQPGSDRSRAPTLPLRVQRTRSFDTPDFRGMTFVEVEAKTALNRVKGMPFKWSINPYRGCSHACSYCLGGDTPILMADGRTKPVRDVAVGDAIYGTVRRGACRRYTITRVLDHWSTSKPAYRLQLEDGTQLISSGDHRFLTERGWKHVTGTEQGRFRRPHLTLNDKVMGTGSFAHPPKPTEEYRRGYLCGMIRGDAHSGSYTYARAGRSQGGVRRFRLASVDAEALQRTQDFLGLHGVSTTQFPCSAAPPTRKPLTAVRTQSRTGVERVIDLIDWPARPSADWCKGFLAGVFDAEGSYSSGILRFSNTDRTVLGHIASCLRRFGFSFCEAASNRCEYVGVRGGLREHLRFFHLTDPAITRKRAIAGQAIKSQAPLRISAIEPFNFDVPLFDLTTGTGDYIADGVVSHNCFARPTHTYLNLSPLEDFERTIVVKTNLVEVLRREVARPSWSGEHVAMGTNTDPYQRAEGRYRLLPGVIEALAGSRTPFSILTKGTLITRDVAALQEAAGAVPVTAAFTIGMLDEQLWRSSEPGTPSPQARLSAVGRLNDAGIPTGVMLAPIMPGLNDDHVQLEALIDAAARAGATHITPIVLHLRPGVREVFWPWLEREYPHLVPRYRALYLRSEAAKEYRDAVVAFVAERRRAAQARHGVPPQPTRPRGGGDRDAGRQRPTGQLRLW